MKFWFLLILSSISMPSVWGQFNQLYTTDTLHFKSETYEGTIHIPIHVPTSYNIKGKDKTYPLIFLFDCQNSNTYQQHLNSISYLTYWGQQMPECVIVGFPFKLRERTYYTSHQYKTDETISGIEKTEQMIFEELLPLLKRKVEGINYTIFVGHSRTGHLVNYFLMKRPQTLDAIVSTSGFFTSTTKPFFRDSLFQALEKRTVPLKYYQTVGDSYEEENYKEDFDDMAAHWKTLTQPKQLQWQYVINPNANHMTNYVLTVPYILLDIFADYNKILNEWFDHKLANIPVEKALETYQQDLNNVLPGTTTSPTSLHIMSLASHYFHQTKNNKVALEFLNFGEQHFKKSLDFQLFYAEIYFAMDKKSLAKKHLSNYLRYKKQQTIAPEDVEVYEDWYNSLQEKL